MANSSYRTLAELHTNVRRREIELELHAREEGESQVRDQRPMQSQLAMKLDKPANTRAGGQKGRTCGK